MRTDVVDLLRCPLCGAALDLADGVVACAHDHRFDVARQGYVNLLVGSRRPGTADTADMVAARAQFLAAGHFAPVHTAVADAARQATATAAPMAEAARSAPFEGAAGTTTTDGADAVVDLGAGPGTYLAAVLDALPDHIGLALDVSKYAARRAARCHPRAGAAVCDTWATLPVAPSVADVVLNVFAPRNGPEMARVLRPGGAAVVVAPTPHHLGELRSTLGLLDVADDKRRRIAETLAPHLVPVDDTTVTFVIRLRRADVTALAAMGPSAHHLDGDVAAARIAALPEPVNVTASVVVSTFRPPPAS